MTSSKPYLVRGLNEWILDNGQTPYVLITSGSDQVVIPPGIAQDGKVVLNISPDAVRELVIDNEAISFSARFNGVSQDVYCPMAFVLAIYARENGEGMMFPEEDSLPDNPADIADDKKAPSLTLIK